MPRLKDKIMASKKDKGQAVRDAHYFEDGVDAAGNTTNASAENSQVDVVNESEG
ncbi:hypothetical protein [Caudoviricetes sp.]|nr:hypothetical protein [Caudoviricetes sp.]